MLLLAASLIIGSAFPMASLGDVRAFEGRWVLVAPPTIAKQLADFQLPPIPLRVAASDLVGKSVALINPSGRIVRTWNAASDDKLRGFVADWLNGTSLAPGSVAPDPRLIARRIPSVSAPGGWWDAIGICLRLVQPGTVNAPPLRKGLLVMFLSTSGPVDLLYRERIGAAAIAAASAGIDVIALFPNQGETALGIASADYGFSTALDTGCGLADAYRATATPEVFLLDASFKVVYTGSIDSSTWGGEAATAYLLAAIRALADSREPAIMQTVPFGTAIIRR